MLNSLSMRPLTLKTSRPCSSVGCHTCKTFHSDTSKFHLNETSFAIHVNIFSMHLFISVFLSNYNHNDFSFPLLTTIFPLSSCWPCRSHSHFFTSDAQQSPSPSHPMFLINIPHHSLLANSLSLRAGGCQIPRKGRSSISILVCSDDGVYCVVKLMRFK